MQSAVSLPLFAPMNSATTHKSVPRNRHRKFAFTVSLSLLLSLNLAPTFPQSRNQKRITSVWTATSAAGSIVHVVSDSAVNDYEAYTRGGRFYVKIPASDLPSARGSLLGRGFDDVQIQRYGDGIIISFHLLPGTSARVQQTTNRLEIVFTTPGSVAAARTAATDESNRTRTRRVSDAAGTAPDSVSRTPRAPAYGANATRGASRRNDSSPNPSSGASNAFGKRSGVEGYTDRGAAGGSETPKPAASREVAAASPLPSASPVASASPNAGTSASTASPGSASSSSPSSSSSLSQASPVQQPSRAATPAAESSNTDTDWRSRLNYWKVWAQLNWIPLLLGGIVLLALLAFMFFRRSAKRVSAEEASSPKPAAVSNESVETKTVAATDKNPVAAQTNVASVAASQTPANQTQSSVTSPAEPPARQEVDPDREVFEL